MNDILENIKNRRSVRSFTTEKITKEDLDLIIEAAIFAPSGRNKQTWRFTVVQDESIITRLMKVIENELDRPNYNFYNAKTLILVSNERDNSNGYADCCCALQNIFLMAHSLGIGSCWINQLKTICDSKTVREILTALEIPQNHIVWGTAALGYAQNKPTVPLRNEGTVKYFL